MTARCVIAGSIAPRSQPAAMRVCGVVVAPTRTPIAQLSPLGAAVRTLCDGILRGDVEPCACGRFACDCDEWGEIMAGIDAAERGELGDYESEAIPF